MGNAIRSCLAVLCAMVSFLWNVPAHAGVSVREETELYSVSGNTGAAIYKDIGRKGPRIRKRKGHFIATADIDYDITNVKSYSWNKQCLIESIDVVINVTYTLPKWKPHNGASRELKSAWRTFIDTVRRHEKQHVKIARDSAYELWRALKGVKGDLRKGCRDMSTPLRKAADKVWQRYEIRQKQFDNSSLGVGGQAFGSHYRLVRAK